MKSFFDNIELWLSGAGVAVILLVPRLGLSEQHSYWSVMAVTALIVGVLHGVIFWLVRRRQRRVRDEALREIKSMLMDRVNNKLNVISMHVEMQDVAASRETMDGVQSAVRDVTNLLDSLSEESLTSWKQRYAQVLQGRPQ
ncbi:MAG: hypothetical protein IBJ03_03150 [Gemmatimonadaceae bacterium]|nr:hypothetical protein [Gemmatimonadaceae bacterium]